ncbi:MULTISPECIES: glutathione S-transferase [Variovorax]|jgi:glutathione S-transferase|uniref:glutathione S-transferase n=1 Tax=Variovorax TaxID=34072 RepID=UPI00086F36D6|nr:MULTISPECIES: glutathione S-transferase [Variovorax]MBN8758602.1 glutathione S-transferase [Variovorax sp.]ODU11641.1 MAG: glutathione S-transferase [Variovorax sp. SCN 67-85]ODV14994.1 MAG: glutathione S-transferase [Variovorax sp. SCN 67-20]OJZ05285.1 MAG: glutathione S-transferase [Variovorax sp. 67-131]UKI05276.1 glutathione S-transferase [Variovorax paradoxus]
MQLVGMLDSPFVRRAAISLRLLGVPFEHRSVSVFSTFEQFRGINPVVKAPTLVCDDGTVLMDSTLIIDYAEALSGRSLMPAALAQRVRALRITGLALAGCEKTVQIVYEHNLRPAEKLHQPWVDRVRGQLVAAYSALEQELATSPLSADERAMTQAGVSTAVAWSFTQLMLADVIAADGFPMLSAYAARVESLPVFLGAPQV